MENIDRDSMSIVNEYLRNCNCTEDFDVRCVCLPQNLYDFQKCPIRIQTMVWLIGNDYDNYHKAINNNFSFLNKFLPENEHQAVIDSFKETQEEQNH